MDLNSSEEPKSTTKEILEEEMPVLVPLPPSPVPIPVPPFQPKQKENIRCKMPNNTTKPRRQCVDRKKQRTTKDKTKKSAKSWKNKKEKDRQELALKIHEDVETENETMSADEWDEPLVIISTTKSIQSQPFEKTTSKVVSFSKDDFPSMPQCSALNTRNNSTSKQTWELPRLSHCFSSLNLRKQRQVSECDSEDSFIVFDNDDKSTPSSIESNQSICDRIRSTLLSGLHRQISESSDDDFICFEMEQSDADDDEDCDQIATSDSECESEVDILSSGTNPPDSGFEEKKVRFNLIPVVHVLRTWTFAYHQARKGEWEQYGRDRVRFHDRIKRLESTLVPILNSDHRQKIYRERFLNHADNNICDKTIAK